MKKTKIGRNSPCSCKSGKKFKQCCLKATSSMPSYSWQDKEGFHLVASGHDPSSEQLEKMTEEYQNKIRNSPIWNQMVKKYGKEKAEELLKQCRAELR
jgi:hypothetical protein